jgi:hypothetical protein
MRVDIRGNYLIADLVTAMQHLAVQLEDLGIEAVEDVSVSLVPLRAGGKRLALTDDAGVAEHLILEIEDLARPCVGTGRLRVVEPPAPRRTQGSAPRKSYAKRTIHARTRT